MRKRRIFWLLIGISVAVVAIVGLVMVLTREREPEYAGKKLSDWVEINSSDGSTPSQREEAESAIQHIGTNAIPYLLDWIRYEPPAWKVKLSKVAFERVRIDLVARDKKLLLSAGTVNAFGALGHEARTAIPELTRLMNEPRRFYHSIRALHALSHTGREGLPPLLAVLTNDQTWYRWTVASDIGRMGTNALPAVPALIQGLQDTNFHVAVIAATSLGTLRLELDRVVPALVNSLQHPKREVRNAAALALGELGDNARPATPALLSLLSDPEILVRLAATKALREIDPLALEKGGIP